MKGVNPKIVAVFMLGMVTFATGVVLYTVFLNPRRPQPVMTVENRGRSAFGLTTWVT